MTAVPLDAVCQLLAPIAPLGLAEAWDNVGLLVGDRSAPIRRVMTCLSVTPAVVDEAVRRRVDLIITHHPLPFKPLVKITSDSTTGRMLLGLIAAGVAVYSAHTAFDSAVGGINALWAQRLGLQDIVPLVAGPESEGANVGGGRCGRLAGPTAVDALAESAAAIAGVDHYRVVATDKAVHQVGIACGSGGSFLPAAAALGCDALISGEATFHTCLEAEALGVALILLGHYGSERFAVEQMAVLLSERASRLDGGIEVFVSAADVDPLRVAALAPKR